MIALVIVGVAVWVLRTRSSDGAGTILAFPPWPPADSSGIPSLQEFVGAEACRDCHRAQYDAWSGSTHGRAGGPPGVVELLRAFNGRPIRFRDATVTPRVVAGRHEFLITRNTGEREVLRVDGVIGGGHMVGGGTQGFITHAEDGTWRFLPFELVRREDTWFCNTSTRLDRGWIAITETMSLTDCGDWPPQRVVGELPRFANCQGCHASQVAVAPEPGRPHVTSFASLAINCESCHGPGRRHVEIARSGRIASEADIGMRALATLTTNESLGVCFQCHAMKDALTSITSPGAPLAEQYSLALPLLGEEPLFADGRVRTFAYQQGHLYSDCYRSGSMTCVDCHEPHGQGYRDVNGHALAGRFADGQCTSCHASKAIAPQLHTRHAADSEGSRCVACHMPYLQMRDVGDSLRYARSDHTIPIPRPAFDANLGVEVACQNCHRNRSVDVLQADVDRWWGQTKPHPRAVAALAAFDTARGTVAVLRDPRFLLGVAVDTAGRNTMARFTALGQLMLDVLRPDGGLDDASAADLRRLTTDGNDDIAAAALAALHYASGEERNTRRFLVEEVGRLGERERRVRSRWAVLLGFVADQRRVANDATSAVASYRKSLEIRPGDAHTLMNMGLALAAAGQNALAEQAYTASLSRDPTNSLAQVNLGVARTATGDVAGAERAYRDAIAINTADPLPHFNLGNIAMRRGDPRAAIEHYRRAIRLEPSLAVAHYNLARAHMALGDPDSARAALREGIQFDPRNAQVRQAIRELDAALGPGSN